MIRNLGENTLGKKIVIIFIVSALFAHSIVFSQEEENLVEDKTSKELILAKLGSVENLSIIDFVGRMSQVNSEIEEYINIKEQECSGEYTSFTINERGDKVFQKNKLTKNLINKKVFNEF